MKNHNENEAQIIQKKEEKVESRTSLIKKVSIEPGCITCGACEFITPEVFEVTDICRVRKNAPIKEQEDAVRQAAQACPVNVIKIDEE